MEQRGATRTHVYSFSGRIHPERYGWGIGEPYEVIVYHHDGASSQLRITIVASQVNVTVHTNGAEPVLDMKNRVTRLVRNLADALGHVTGASLDVEIISCIAPDGNSHVFNTGFDGLIRYGVGSKESQRIFNVLIVQATRSQFVRMALSDLRSAIREPLGHSSVRAAMIYQHATRDRDRAIARVLGELVREVRQEPAEAPEDQRERGAREA